LDYPNAGSKTEKRSRADERYFEEFNYHFWERSETLFDILHNANTFTRRRHRNRTPPPTYEVPSILSTSHCESITNQRNRSASPIRRVPNSGNNTNNASRNLSNVTYSSSSELINITLALNLSALQNDSDLSMPNIEGPLESINEE
ncbi:10799_t:CDS:2, partial [Cetraspora pellucida]